MSDQHPPASSPWEEANPGLELPARVEALRHALRADTSVLDRLAHLAARALRAPVAQVNLVAREGQISVSSVGPPPWEGARRVSLDFSFCKHVAATGEALVLADAREHPLTRDNPSTTGSGIVAYAAVPLLAPVDLVLGTLCVVDFVPRAWSPEEIGLLTSLADFVMMEIQRRGHTELELLHATALLESTSDALVGVDLNGGISSWNAGAEQLFGYGAAEAVGRPVEILAAPGEHGAVEDVLVRIRNGEPVPRYEAQRCRRDGSRVHVSVICTPVRDLGGRVVGATALLRDITARVVAEAALRRSESRFRALVENQGEIITILDEAGGIRYKSPAVRVLLGYEPEQLVGQSVFDLVHQDDLPVIRRTLSHVLARPGENVSYTVRLRHADGSWRLLEGWVANLLHDTSVQGVVANCRDVTQRVQLEEELRQSQKMETVGRLAGGVAHDFNNILTAIRGNAEFLLNELPAGHPSRGNVLEIREATSRAAGLTRQLLTFSRRQVLRPRALQLNDVVREIDSMLRRIVGEDIEVVTRLDPELGAVQADPGQVGQVLMNLVANARDAMPNGGSLVLETRSAPAAGDAPGLDAPGVVLRVSDTGEGMTREVRERLFEPFFTTKEVGKGTGLGLSTVYGIVEQSGGTIRVQSEVGRGTTFEILLPGTRALPEARQGTPEVSARPRSGTILLVEDDPAVRKVIRSILEQRGYRVLAAGDGREALKIVEEDASPIDLLLTDVIMPRMNGRELSEQVRSRRAGTRVLFVSGYTDEAVGRSGGLDAGDDFLQKPFEPQDLIRRVEEIISRGAGESG